MRLYWVKKTTGSKFILRSGQMKEEGWLGYDVWVENSKVWVDKSEAKQSPEEAIEAHREIILAELKDAKWRLDMAEEKMRNLNELSDAQQGGGK